MRKLKTSDIPVLCRCMKKIGVKDQLQALAKEQASIQEALEKLYEEWETLAE